MKIALLAHRRFPIAPPFAGGLESFTWHLARSLRDRGIAVTVFAGPGSDPALGLEELSFQPVELGPAARRDSAMTTDSHVQETFAYLQLMRLLAQREDLDVIHNNSLHYLPIMLNSTLPSPILTSLHTPPTPWLEPALRLCGDTVATAAVSHAVAKQWAGITSPRVILNGIDIKDWPMADGGDDLVWSGRIVPEKAPHIAALIAKKAGRRLRLAGPVSDSEYFEQVLRPLLDEDIQHVGHLMPSELAALVGASSACLVTPDWDEPFGLVAVEAMACGTPVLALRRGGLAEVVKPPGGRTSSGDGYLAEIVGTAVEVLPEVESMDRRAVRRYAKDNYDITNMVDRYVEYLRGTPLLMIGYYVHHHGVGHITRASHVARHLRSPVTGFSSLPKPASWPGDWLQLPSDVTHEPCDPAAGGVLHWAPLQHGGYARRMAMLSSHMAGLDLMVVDVSVEVSLLARLHGVPTVVLAMRGDRSDPPHRMAYDSASALLVPWSQEFPEPWWPTSWTTKSWFVGAMSRFDDHTTVAVPAHGLHRRVLVLFGGGGHDVTESAVTAAAEQTPGWQWTLRSAERPSPDLWKELGEADVVVSHGGNNAVAEVAAAQRPAIIVPQRRPFNEQHHTAAALDRAGICVGLETWPEPDQWRALLERALLLGAAGWSAWNPLDGAVRAARHLDDMSVGRTP